MIRKHKNFSRPKKAFEITRIKSENSLMELYGLKNKKEIWKTIAKVGYYRHRAMDLSKAPTEEQELFFTKLRALGLEVSSISDVLALTVENLLKRRLQTITMQKKFANTMKHARQLIAHKLILIDGRACSVPSYIVPVAEESKLTLKPSTVKAKKEEVKTEVTQ
ncbi:MAG: 30S ribosomal protein S4 [Nanoarchaeota archaeon]